MQYEVKICVSETEQNGTQREGPSIFETSIIRERDLDLLLIEELYASPSFWNWLVRHLNLDSLQGARFVSACHSVKTELGESDVEIEFTANGRRGMLMVENKIDASFQKDQSVRYVQRAKRKARDGYHSAQTVLLAPKKYSGGHCCGFDRTISYEDLLDWFGAEKQLGERRTYKLALLNAAIRKGSASGDGKHPHSVAFFREYWKLAEQLAPELRMIDTPRDGGFLYFRPANCPRRMKLMHRITHGYVDLQIRAMGARVDELRTVIQKLLPLDFEVRRAGRSAAIGLKVPQLIRHDSFEPQRSRAITGIQQLKHVWEWFVANQGELLRVLDQLNRDHDTDVGRQNRPSQGIIQ